MPPNRSQLTLSVDSSRRRLRAIVLQATGHRITVTRVRVTYTQDDYVEFTEPTLLGVGDCTSVMELPGNYRPVRRVLVDYQIRAGDRRGPGRLTLYSTR